MRKIGYIIIIMESNLKILDKLFDSTGTKDGTYKGFILFCIDESGNPKVETKAENNATFMLLKTWVKEHEKFIKNSEGEGAE